MFQYIQANDHVISFVRNVRRIVQNMKFLPIVAKDLSGELATIAGKIEVFDLVSRLSQIEAIKPQTIAIDEQSRRLQPALL